MSTFFKGLSFVFVIGFITFLSINCKGPTRGEQLAITYCGACHLMPKPNLLDKTTWKNGALPQMAILMGLKSLSEAHFSMEDIYKITKTGVIPSEPMLSEKEWQAIQDYYIENAPEKLSGQPKTTYQALENSFEIKKYPALKSFLSTKEITLIKYEKTLNQITVGTRQNNFYHLNPKSGNIIFKDSLNSPLTDIAYSKNNYFGITVAGKLEPNNDDNGFCILGNISTNKLTINSKITQLQRPVNIAFADLNQDKKDEAIIASFGYFTGKLSWYELPENKPPVEHILKQVAGATCILVKDMNKDNLPDIVALFGQGNEGVFIFYNKGNSNFEERQVLKFPPVYGSLHMELQDFNKDGFVDILYTNGDNGDYSQIFKPYHGVRVFLNDGKNNFSEKYFFPIYGAMKSVARDFDNDGDLDIATISFFPNYDISPQKSFVYLKNEGNYKFVPAISKKTDTGRWMVMDAFDYDQDGDQDILLGACYDAVRFTKTKIPKTNLLILENKFH